MITLRRGAERGHTSIGWLDSRHTFSFGEYNDPAHLGFRSLRVINEDRVAPGRGFAPHAHRDMEIVSYVLAGALEHKDSLGTGSVIRPGEVQRMSAGTGVTHSEYNPSRTEPVHFLQIWLYPERRGLPPRYEQKEFPQAERSGRWRLVVSPDGADGSLQVHQDARILSAFLDAGQTVAHALAGGRHAWLQVAGGSLTADGLELQAGDGLAVSDEPAVSITARASAEVLLFDLA